jgi:eukaryotic-like serine/threonine-protein kinase
MTAAAPGTVEALLARIAARGGSELPAVAKTMGEVTAALRSPLTSAQDIANLILKDVSLTNTMLRVVNSAFYRPAAGPRISTISRAVVTLGIEAVTSLLMGIRVFEHFNGRKGIAALKKSTVHALLTSVHARELARAVGAPVEESFVAGMLHDLGMLLVAFHLPEEMAQIEQLVAKERLTPDAASVRVLGASLRQLGLGVAEQFALPLSVREGIQGWQEGAPAGPSRIGPVVAFASDLSAALAIVEPKARAEQVAKLRARYARVCPISDKALEQVLKVSETRLDDLMVALRVTRQDLEKYAPALFPHDGRRRSRPGLPALPGQPARGALPSQQEGRPVPRTPQSLPGAEGAEAAHPGPARPEAELVRELEDISIALTSDVPVDDVLTMILETLCRAVPATSAALTLVSPAGDALQGKLAMGERAELLRTTLRISLLDSESPVAEAARDQVELVVEKAEGDGRLSSLGIPVPASLAFLPIVIKGILSGALFVERTSGRAFGARDLGPLRLLRNQASMALRQR